MNRSRATRETGDDGVASAGTGARPLHGVRVAIAYDGLFPWTIGGAERWYRALAEGLVQAGAHVTYLTRLQWDEPPQLDGIEVVAVHGPRELYHPDGTRRADQPPRYGAGLFLYLLRNRRSFDILHLANFPYFSLLAARAALLGTRVPMFVDWHEIWPASYWTSYGGPVLGRVGYLVQQLCVRLTPQALVFWNRSADRLRAHGLRSNPVILPGLLRGPSAQVSMGAWQADSSPTVFFSGRHIEDKGVRLLPDALALARERISGLRMVVAGEGPQTSLVRARVAELGLAQSVDFVGKLTDTELTRQISLAACVVVPSRREGYGMAAVEANANGTPAVVTDGPENAAVGHIREGRNGYIVPPTPAGLAAGILKAIDAGHALRLTTLEESTRMTAEHGIGQSVERVITLYAQILERAG
ncbi:MAG: glycosyltransferase [Actinomycetota bacterium]|nr:glycosyltransferase [Actinomycetota bacterium]